MFSVITDANQHFAASQNINNNLGQLKDVHLVSIQTMLEENEYESGVVNLTLFILKPLQSLGKTFVVVLLLCSVLLTNNLV